MESKISDKVVSAIIIRAIILPSTISLFLCLFLVMPLLEVCTPKQSKESEKLYNKTKQSEISDTLYSKNNNVVVYIKRK